MYMCVHILSIVLWYPDLLLYACIWLGLYWSHILIISLDAILKIWYSISPHCPLIQLLLACCSLFTQINCTYHFVTLPYVVLRNVLQKQRISSVVSGCLAKRRFFTKAVWLFEGMHDVLLHFMHTYYTTRYELLM